ncbi:MAG TPA: beta-propeller domain-containing protein [Allosphingosinicella sp.]|nr:beta-propeller domain-containing protein [Allosphingosinicella sp.]
MRTPLLLASLAALSLAGAGAMAQPSSPGAARPSGGLAAFRSDAELRAYLRRLKRDAEPIPPPSPPPPPPMPAPPPPPPPGSAPAPVSAISNQEVKLQGTAATGDIVNALPQSITNNQEATVDEGDIVKVSGQHLVILRRGRLFTVSLAGGGMRPVDSINAFPPGVSGRGDWYDEMLISGDRIVVVGYSYARGGTEINRFRIDPAGRLRFEDAWHLRSNDYYSSRNYASRLIGNRLIFYTPLYLEWDEDPFEALPGVRRWRGDDRAKFRRIAPARNVYIAPVMRNSRRASVDTVHSVTSCSLAAAELDCSAVAVLGPESRTFYVSPQAVYLWVSDAWDDDRRRGPDSWLYRLPFGRERPSAVGARGAPVDQFSFREDGAEGVLNVLLRGESGGDFMFAPEVSGRGVALARVRFSDLGDGSRELPRRRYRVLPEPGPNSWSFQNRFAGRYVLYGGGAYGRAQDNAKLIVAPIRGGPVAELIIPHSVGRLDLLGSDAIAIGEAPRGLGFSTVELPAAGPRLGDHYLLPDAAEGETRSHAFFFSPDPATPDGASGTIGLPVARRADPKLARFFGSSAAMLFLRRDRRRLSHAGELDAETRGVADDGCQASCVDWYGNARPIFLGGRTFALLGYELVEGELRNGRIREVGRISFAPRPPARQ